MARTTSTPTPAKPAAPTTETVEAPSAPVVAPEAAPAAAVAAPTPAPTEELGPNDGTVGGTGTVTDKPAAKDPDPPLREDGPTPSEWADRGYDPAKYPPHGYAAKPDEPVVKYYRVKSYCRFVRDGVIAVWKEGLVIDSLNFDIADVRAQGLPIERCDGPTANDLKPSIGHWSV